MMIMDTSGSMAAEDLKPNNRFEFNNNESNQISEKETDENEQENKESKESKENLLQFLMPLLADSKV